MAKARRRGRPRPAPRPGRLGAAAASTGGPTAQPKTRFPTQDEANRSALQLRLEEGADLDPYRCRICGGWHLGNPGGDPGPAASAGRTRLYRPDGIVPWAWNADGATERTPAPPPGAADTKRRIIDAAEEVVLRDGVARLTLDAAAAEAGLSKGGVLYHFPTRDALVAGMVDKIIEEFDRDIERQPGRRPPGPGRFTRAYIRATMTPSSTRPGPRGPAGRGAHRRRRGRADLLVPLQVAADRWQARLEDDGLDPTMATCAAGLRRSVAVRPVRPGPTLGRPAGRRRARAGRLACGPVMTTPPVPGTRRRVADTVGPADPDPHPDRVPPVDGGHRHRAHAAGVHPPPGRLRRPGRGGHGRVLRRRRALPVPDRPSGRPDRTATGADRRPGHLRRGQLLVPAAHHRRRSPSPCGPSRASAPGRPRWPHWP